MSKTTTFYIFSEKWSGYECVLLNEGSHSKEDLNNCHIHMDIESTTTWEYGMQGKFYALEDKTITIKGGNIFGPTGPIDPILRCT